MARNLNGTFAGKVAFVTGAANGIGRATVEYASKGIRINAACPGTIKRQP